jgi:hypothetical protein
VAFQPAGNDVSVETVDVVGIRCQATPSEKTEILVRTVVTCKVYMD